MTSQIRNQNETEKAVFRYSYTSGMRTGITTFIATSGLSLAGHYMSPWYRNRLGVSGKVALPVMAAVAAFTIKTETLLLAHRRDPEGFLSKMGVERLSRHITKVREEGSAGGHLTWYHKGANWVYDHPFRTLVMAAIPAVGGIAYSQSLDKNVLPSQRVMHTRVYGQMTVLGLLIGSMAFHDWMEKRGKFE